MNDWNLKRQQHPLVEPDTRILAFSYLLWPRVTDDVDAGKPARARRRHPQAA